MRATASAPFASKTEVKDASCPSASFCALVDNSGDLLTSTDPGDADPSAWSITQLRTRDGLISLSCPSADLCVAGDRWGNIFVSSDPTGGAQTWSQIALDPEDVIEAISCPSDDFCVAADESGNLFVSTDPTGGVASWKIVNLQSASEERFESIWDVSCASASLCVAVTTRGKALVATAPAAGAGAWQSSAVPGVNRSLNSVSCPTEQLCVATDDAGHVFTSTSPSDGGDSWSSIDLGEPAAGGDVVCPAEDFCAIAGWHSILTSGDPTGAAASWQQTDVITGPGWFESVACASSDFCLAGENKSGIFTSADPTGGEGAWSHVALNIGESALVSLSCTSRALCVGVDNAGNAVHSTDPVGSTGPWESAHIDENKLNDVDCPSTQLCVAVDNAGNVVATHEPTGPASAWETFDVDSASIEAVECPKDDLCLAIDAAGYLLTSSAPVSGSWSAVEVSSPDGLEDLSCAEPQLCVILDRGLPRVSNNPSGAPASWSYVEGFKSAESVSCVEPELCVGVEFPQTALITTFASSPEIQWSTQIVDSLNGFEQVGCAEQWVCIATTYGSNGSTGNVLVLSDPQQKTGWVQDNVYGHRIIPPNPMLSLYSPDLTDISCTSDEMCAITDRSGHVMLAVPATPAAPSNQSLPTVSGGTAPGDTVVCDAGTWSGEPEPELAFQWLRDSAAVPGANQAVYSLGPVDESHSLSCLVTASNFMGSSEAKSSALSIPRQPAPPEPPQSPQPGGATPGLGATAPTGSPVGKFRLLRAKVHGKRIGLRFDVPGPGKVSAVAMAEGGARKGPSCGSSARGGLGPTRQIGRAATSVYESGAVGLVIKLRPPVLREFAAGLLCIRVAVSYVSKTGDVTRVSSTVTPRYRGVLSSKRLRWSISG